MTRTLPRFLATPETAVRWAKRHIGDEESEVEANEDAAGTYAEFARSAYADATAGEAEPIMGSSGPAGEMWSLKCGKAGAVR